MSPIAQMERLHHPIHVGFGRHLEGARAFHFKSLSISVIGVIGGFNSLFQGLILFILSEVSGEAPGWDLGLLGC
jgi:hypothetical protein